MDINDIENTEEFKELCEFRKYKSCETFKQNPYNDDFFDFSFLIPVYNTAKYLKKCLNSLKKIDVKYNVEFIIVNNGSTDNSLDIINNYSNDSRFKIYSKEFGSASTARNFALSKASGKYIAWIDSDDFINHKVYEEMMSILDKQQYDIIQSGYKRYYKGISYSSNANSEGIGNMDDLYGMPWGGFHKRSLYRNIVFPINFCYEDTMMRYVIYPKAQDIYFLKSIGYFYRKNSLSYTNIKKNIYKGFDSLYVVYNIICNDFEYYKNCNWITSQLIKHLKLTLLRLNDLNEKLVKYVILVYKNIINCMSDVNNKVYTYEELLNEINSN